MPKSIQVFEHSRLYVGEHGFTTNQFNALVRYNDRHGCTYFTVGHNRLIFNSFVGVIQVGDLAIEILPKLDNSESNSVAKWQNALLQMLRQSGLINVEASPEADLKLRRCPLIDIYLESFLNEVQQLAHAGLSKRYRLTEGNLHKLKGRIQFAKHLSKNMFHRERMFTAHEVYDRDNRFNRILKRALLIVEHLAVRPTLTARASEVLLWFEDVANSLITADTFKRLAFNRNTERYRKVIQLARLIILNYSPDLQGGRENVIAILFDMNVLFERFILVQLHRAKSLHLANRLQINGQVRKYFWGSKTIRPDVVATFNADSRAGKIILDTKWKIPYNGKPADDDLKQMFAYNVHFGGQRSVLVYPMAGSHHVSGRIKMYHPGSLQNVPPWAGMVLSV